MNLNSNNCCSVAATEILRRIFQLPYSSHSYFLPILGDTLSVYDEICKRSIKFIATTLVSSSKLVQSIVMFGRYRSFLGTNALLCCDRYNWSLSELISKPEQLSIFHLNAGIFMVYLLTFKKLVPVLCLI